MRYFVIIILSLLALQVTPKFTIEKNISVPPLVTKFSIEDSIKVKEDFICFCESEPAEFPGKEDSLNNFITSNYNQPDTAPDSLFTKMGRVQFTIGKNGKIEAFEVKESVGYGCDEEIIRILKLTRWKPAMILGNRKPIKDYRLLPYTIKFEPSDEKETNSNISPQSAPCAPHQMPLVIS